MKTKNIIFWALWAMTCSFYLPFIVVADEKPLVISMKGDATTMDPHGRSETTNQIITSHIFSRLIKDDDNLKPVPYLAKSWKMLNDYTWEFQLQKGIKFTNGEHFNAAAAKYSLERAKKHPKSQLKYRVPDYEKIEAADPYTLQIKTKSPCPGILSLLSGVAMVAPKYYQETEETRLNTQPVGAGPYKLVKWIKDDHIELVYNDQWTFDVPDFKRVIFKPIPEGATRVAALVSGEIDIADTVSIPDIPRIKRSEDTYVMTCPSLRAIYLMFDVFTDKGGPAPKMQPGIPAGMPNPFKDIRVRKAIAHAVHVDDIIKYVMEGSAYPASQLVTRVVDGYNPDITRPRHDLALAKKLLSEAGYPKGFEATFDAPNDRYINDSLVAEAIAGQLKKIGIRLTVMAQPKATFFAKIEKYESPMFLVGWSQLDWVATMDRMFRTMTKEHGRNNRGRFSDPALERRMDEAAATTDPAKRTKLFREISVDAYATYFILPLYYEQNVYGVSKRVVATCRADEHLYAFDLKRAKGK